MKTRGIWWGVLGVGVVYLMDILWKVVGIVKRKNLILEKGRRRKRLIRSGMEAAMAELGTVTEEMRATILSSTLTDLISLRDSGKVTCAQILLTYIHQTLTCDPLYHFVLDERLLSAYNEAVDCDRLISQGLSKGILTGIPFSAKDVYCCKGLITTFGCANLSDNTVESDGTVIEVLKRNGAIVMMKGAMGMLGVTAETSNRIVGVTLNPWDPTRVPGGSSGGDAVAVCTRCVPFAMGSDVGGSVRYPAAYCGLYAIKTTANRLSGKGPLARAGHPPLFTSYGPIARSVDDLVVLCRVMMSEKQLELDPVMPPLVWREDMYKSTSPLRIGIVTNDPYWPISLSNKRVLDLSASYLSSLGHTLLPFPLTDLYELCELCCVILFSSNEGAVKVREEPPLYQISHVVKVKLTPVWLRGIMEWWYGSRYYAMVWKGLKDPSIQKYYSTVNRILALRREFHAKLQALNIDALLVPYPFPAFQHDMTPSLHYSTGYTLFANLFDVPAGHVPIDLVQEGEETYAKIGNESVDETEKVMKGAKGLPVGVQVVTRRYQEETCLRVMKVLQEHFQFKQAPPSLRT